MKKKLSILLVLLVLLSAAIALAACGAKKTPHEHSFTEWQESSAATCSQEGERTRTCTECGEVEKEPIPKTEHTPVTEGAIPATCLDEGQSGTVKCGVCGTVLEQSHIIEPLGHSMSEEWEHDVEDGEGVEYKHYHYKSCTRENCEYIQKVYCQLKEKVVPATCDEDGFKKLECEVCKGGEVVETYAKKGHKWGDYTYDPESKTHKRVCENDATHIEQESCSFADKKIIEDATCVKDGSKEQECTKCHGTTTLAIPATGHKYDETYHKNAGERTHYRNCLNCGDKLVEGCDPTVQIHEATCVDAGYTEYTCRHCKDSYIDDETPAKGHNLSAPTPVYLENGEEGEHVHQHEQVCLNANCEHKVVTECKLEEKGEVPATCTSAGYKKLVCPDCQSVHEQVTQEAQGHAYTYSIMDGTYPYTHKTRCSKCNSERVDYCQMTYTETKPTCVEKGGTFGECAFCIRRVRRGNEIAALGHDYGAWEYTGDKVENHTHHRVCTRDGCTEETDGHEQTGECQIVTTESLSTCEEAGGSKTACKICLTSISENTIEPLGHSFGPWQPDSKQGDHYHTCSKCATVEREPHAKIVNEYEATCEAHAKTVTTCEHCAYELVEEDTGDPVKGHDYHLESYSSTEHYARCMNCGDIQHGPHDFSKSNICTYCPHDGLIYENMGAHYIVKSDDALLQFKPKRIIIPAEHGEDGSDARLPVTQIARSAFLGNTYIEEVILPVTLEIINDNAFVNCSALRSVSIEGDETGALETIGISAFMKCTSLTSFEAPATLKTIGAGAFDGCRSLVDIKIHDDVQSIGANAFSDTAYVDQASNWTGNVLYIGKHLIKGKVIESDGAALTEVEVRDGTVSINASAFEGELITSIILPDSLTIVEAGAFKDCTSLKKVEYKGDMAGWFKIDFKDELSSPLYYDAALHIDAAHERIVIPNGVTRIPVGTFRGTSITEVVIPSTVTYIGADAFEDCALLAKIEIPTSVTFIGKDAFKNCLYYNTPDNWTDGNALYIDTHLIATKAENVGEEFTVRAGTTTVGIEAFKDCEKLKSVTFAATVVRIGANAFDGCTSLISVTFEDKESGWLASGRIMRFVSPSQIADPTTARAQFYSYYGEWKKSAAK